MTPPTVQFIPAAGVVKIGAGTTVSGANVNIAAFPTMTYTPSESFDPDSTFQVLCGETGGADDGLQLRFISSARRNSWVAAYDNRKRVSVTYDGVTTTASPGWSYYLDVFGGIYRATVQASDFASWSSLGIAGNGGVGGVDGEFRFI